MNTKEQDTSYGNANETDNRSYSETMMQIITDTPFVSVKEEEEKYFMAIGKYRLTESVYKSHKEVEKKAKQVDYQTVLKLIVIMGEAIKNDVTTKTE